MKIRKVYGINGLLEWHGYIEGHGVKMKVDFTNGSATAYGVAPATFTTENELTQYIIENSDQFMKSKILLIGSYPIGEEEVEKKEPKAEQVVEEESLKEIKATCLDDAKEYLVTNFGVAQSKLRSRVQIENAAKANGVKFIWED